MMGFLKSLQDVNEEMKALLASLDKAKGRVQGTIYMNELGGLQQGVMGKIGSGGGGGAQVRNGKAQTQDKAVQDACEDIARSNREMLEENRKRNREILEGNTALADRRIGL